MSWTNYTHSVFITLTAQPNPEVLTIAAVERDTALSKDTLRIWERRYHFPQPLRDLKGERVYSQADVSKLRLLRMLIERGHRPGNIIHLSINALQEIVQQKHQNEPLPADLAQIIEPLLHHDLLGLRQQLLQALMRQGLQQFITYTVSALNDWIGRAWLAGTIAVFDEHIYTEHVQNILRNAIVDQHLHNDSPRILLSSLPGEKHRISLLMVEGMLAIEGVSCVALGAETPIHDVVEAVRAYQADIVALSFSEAFPSTTAVSCLIALRAALSPTIELWAGGHGLDRIQKTPHGVLILRSFEDMRYALQRWRTEHPNNQHLTVSTPIAQPIT